MRIFYITLFSFICIFSQAQNSSLKYATSDVVLYHITDDEAYNIYTHGIQSVDETNFHHIVSKYPSVQSFENIYLDTLHHGHYLLAQATQEKIRYELISSQNCTIEIFNNSRDLIIHVYNDEQEAISSATLYLDGHKIKYNSRVQAYYLSNSNKEGLLQVNYAGHKNFFEVKKLKKNNLISKLNRFIIKCKPLLKISNALRFLVYVPIHSFKYLKERNRYYKGWTLRLIDTKFHDIQNKMEYLRNPTTARIQAMGYMAINKPKFRKNDTLKVAIHILDQYKNPVNRPLSLYVESGYGRNSKKVKITDLPASTEGLYSYNFPLSDTLGLTLDKTYNIALYDRNYKILNRDFKFQQYDLNSLFLEVIPSRKNHTKDMNIELAMKPTDENGLPVNGGKFRIEILASSPIKYYSKEEHIPEKLFDTTIVSSNTGKTIFTIQPSMLPQVDLNYKVQVHYINWNTEKISKSHHLYYKYSGEQITSPKIDREILVNGFVSHGELSIEVENPDSLYFSYFLYKNDKEVRKGFGQQYNYSKKKVGKNSYTLCLQYMRNGTVYDPCYNIKNDLDEIQFEIEHPSKISPGESVEITVRATNYKNKPVKDLYVSANSLTSRFNYKNPRINLKPSTKRRISMLLHNDFNQISKVRKGNFKLRHAFWNKPLELDEIEYYRFRYPSDSIYTSYKNLEERSAQVAPFIFDDGVLQNNQIVYIDYIPVYFGWSVRQPYSFYAREGYRKIGVRTPTHLIEIDSVRILPNEKLILSVDITNPPKNVSVTKAKNNLSHGEKRTLNPYTIGFDEMAFTEPSFLYNADTSKVLFLSPKRANLQTLYGPILDEYRTFEVNDRVNEQFEREGGYSYKISPGYSRLKDIKYKMPKKLHYPFLLRLDDYAYNKRDMENIINDYNLNKNKQNFLRNFRFNSSNKEESGKLILKAKETDVKFFALIPASFETGIYFSYTTKKYFPQIASGDYRLLIVYKDNTCLLHDSIVVKKMHHNYYEITEEDHKISAFSPELDSLFNSILNDNTRSKKENQVLIKQFKDKLFTTYSFPYAGKTIMGYIYDQQAEPIIGAAVIARSMNGMQLHAVVTDFDGKYQFLASSEMTSIEVQYLGMKRQILEIESINFLQNPVNIVLTESGNVLDEVSIKAYRSPVIDYDMTSSAKTVTAESISNSPLKNVQALSATAAGISMDNGNIHIRGSRTSNVQYYVDGIRVTETGINISESEVVTETIVGEEARKVYGVDTVILISSLDSLYRAGDNTKSLRSNFSDEGFWEPFKKTDNNGEVTFQVTFPDDITKWSVHVIGFNEKQMKGSAISYINAFKPLKTKLEVPKFLVKGDSIQLYSRMQKYESDSMQLESSFLVDDKLSTRNKLSLKYAVNDTLFYTATDSNSVDVTHAIKLSTGYEDGEKRTIPIIAQGMEFAYGEFKQLNNSVSFQVPDSIRSEDFEIYMESNELQLMRREILHVHNYKYLCNEQLASKILALLHEKKYCTLTHEEFVYEEDIRKAITILESRYSKSEFWGWWGNGRYNSWISNHVLKAIAKSKEMGYSIKLNYHRMLYSLTSNLETKPNKSTAIDIMNTMQLIDTSLNFDQYFSHYDTIENSDFQMHLEYMKLKQDKNKNVDISFLDTLLHKTILGELYLKNPYGYDKYRYSIRNNSIHHTINALWLYFQESPIKHRDKIDGLKLHLIRQRKNGYWVNTYTSARMIEVLWTMRIESKETYENTVVKLSGDVDSLISSFPFSMKFSAGDQVIINKKGTSSVYYTAYAKRKILDPEERKNDFIIHTDLEEKKNDEYIIKAKVEVLSQAKYVMIEIPIPAGMQYTSKKTGRYPEVHRGHHDEKVSIFCETMEPGKYIFEVPLRKKFTGSFLINPAKIELMYFPTFYANTKIKKINI